MAKRLRAPKTATALYMLAALLFLLVYVLSKTDLPQEDRELTPFEELSGQRFESDGAWYPILIIPGLVILGFIVHHLHRVAVQSSRDRAARAIEERVRQLEHDEQYFLYLRPFSSTGRIKVGNEARHNVPAIVWLFAWHIPWRFELERVIADALAPDGPLVTLGYCGEHFGAARLPVDESKWQRTVQALINNAHGVIVFPSHHRGTLWEIRWLRQSGNLEKTIFVMPPVGPNARTTVEIMNHWQETCETLQRMGIILPKYALAGALFTLGRDGQVDRCVTLDLRNEDGTRDAINGLLPSRYRATAPHRPAVIHLPRD